MDKILERFRAIKWHYAPHDAAARAEIDRRIAEVGRKRALITYSDLVRGITFNLPTLRSRNIRSTPRIGRILIAPFLGISSAT